MSNPLDFPPLAGDTIPPLPNSTPAFPQNYQLGKKSGLTILRDGVAKYFADRSIPIEVARVGAKYRSFKSNQHVLTGANRVVFIPGDFDPTSAQTKARPYGVLNRETRNASSVVNPRELASWERPITISIWAAPHPGKAEAEDDSIAVVEDMLELVVRACQFVQMSQIMFGEVVIVAPPVEQSYGAELLLSAIQRGPLLDETLEYTQATAVVPRTQIGG